MWDIVPVYSRQYYSTSTYRTGYADHTSDSTTSQHVSSSVQTKPVKRLADTTRYGTMAYVTAATCDACDWVVIASGQDFADALCASALAGAHGAPVILTEHASLTLEAQGQLERLRPSHALIVGGEAAVSAATEAAVRATVPDVARVAGADRTSTSLESMKATRSASASSNTVILATGSSFADALSAGAWAWATSSPIVLTGADGALTADEVDAIVADAGIRRVVIVGGTAAVPDTVMHQLGDAFEYVRLGGVNRYETSARVAEWAASNGLSWTRPVVATGRHFSDALCGSALAGNNRSPMLLVDSASDATMESLRAHASGVSGAYVLGGTSAIPQSLMDAVGAAIG